MPSERGSALLLVVLLTLILSAIAMVALRDVARTVQGSAIFRTRLQAQTTSAGILALYAQSVGDVGPELVDAIDRSLMGSEAGTDGVFGGRHEDNVDLGDTGGAATFMERRRVLAVMGGHVECTSSELNSADCPGSAGLLPFHETTAGNVVNTGLFRTAAAEPNFETRRHADFRVIVRDLIDGMPAPNFGPGFCFKKGVIASEGIVGGARFCDVNADCPGGNCSNGMCTGGNWDEAQGMANTRHAVEGLIGPVECGYNR